MNAVSKVYPGGVQALRNITLQIGEGTFGLLGPNGAGKTSLMRILATLLPPTAGDATLFGVPLSDRATIRAMLGYLPQSFGFYPQLTVWETIVYFAQLKGLQGMSRLNELLELTGLADRRGVRVKGLSGGMRQRLGIAVALLNDPKLLIVDEPTAGLDPEGRVEFRNLITTLPGNRTVLLSSHIVEDIAQSAASIAVIDRGELLFTGRPKELVQLAAGRVWAVALTVDQMPALKESHFVVATVREEERMVARCIGPGGPGFVPAAPTLEDGYLALLKGR
ncbi:MAG: ABC transporter ATP-binding protein [Mycobacterium leprae]